MTQETFDTRLRALLRREPFQRFFVDLDGGGRVEIDAPRSVAMNGGAAVYLNAQGDPTFFSCEDVTGFSEVQNAELTQRSNGPA